MFSCLKNWLSNNEQNSQVLVVSEVIYPGFANIADLTVVFDDGNGPSRLYIELKADFNPNSVNVDINLLDLIAGLVRSPITDGFAFYVVRQGDRGWTHYIDDPTQPNIETRAITVN